MTTSLSGISNSWYILSFHLMLLTFVVDNVLACLLQDLHGAPGRDGQAAVKDFR
jgi:hypothetical protein